MNAMQIINQYASKHTRINLENDFDATVSNIPVTATDDEAFAIVEAEQLALESQMGEIDAYVESASTYAEVDKLHKKHIEDDLIEDPAVVEALIGVAATCDNTISDFTPTNTTIEPALNTEAEGEQQAEGEKPAEAAKPAGNKFVDTMKAWYAKLVEWAKALFEKFKSILNDAERLASRLKDAGEKINNHFTTGKEYKINIKSYSTGGDNKISSASDVVSLIDGFVKGADKLDRLATSLGTSSKPLELDFSLPIFNGTFVGKGSDIKIKPTEAEKGDVEIAITATVAGQLKGHAIALADLMTRSTKSIKAVEASLKTLEKAASNASEEGSKEAAKAARDQLTFINLLYKTIIGQGKALTSICAMSPQGEKKE